MAAVLPLVVIVVGLLIITIVPSPSKVNLIHGLGYLASHYAFS